MLIHVVGHHRCPLLFVLDEGIVEGIYPVLPEKFAGLPVTDFGERILIPAFSDLHS